MLKYNIFVLTVLMIFFINNIYADQRNFVWTYQHQIMEPGKAEIEQYTSFYVGDVSQMHTTTNSELNVELEVGMNKWYDFAIYQNFTQSPNNSLKYDGFKLRSRVLLAEKNSFFLDPLIYVEYVGKSDFSQHEIETKLILAKDIGKFNFAFNPYLEFGKTGAENWEVEAKYSLGICYKPTTLFAFGFEAAGGEAGNYIGPTISHGAQHIWVAFSNLFKVGTVEKGSPAYQIRLLVGAEL